MLLRARRLEIDACSGSAHDRLRLPSGGWRSSGHGKHVLHRIGPRDEAPHPLAARAMEKAHEEAASKLLLKLKKRN